MLFFRNNVESFCQAVYIFKKRADGFKSIGSQAKSSCGQCVPCNQGTAQITEYLKKIEFGHGSQDDLEAIFEISGRCTNQNRCFLPTQESLLIPSIINAFPSEFKAHIEGNRDPRERDLILPKLHEYDEDACAFTYDDPAKFPI